MPRIKNEQDAPKKNGNIAKKSKAIIKKKSSPAKNNLKKLGVKKGASGKSSKVEIINTSSASH